ncbi:MAG: hypothetical protein KGI11_08565 [Thaumarchaeota archaeon]|nr:hypothetical protein [Nitrososphaerota archaeon]
MIVNIIDVGTVNQESTKKGKSYQSIEVTYKNDQGQVSSKKLVSFANPAIFTAAKGWQKGDQIDVRTEKDENGYWQWTGINVAGEQAPITSAPKETRVTGSNYETKEERAQRQVYIIRQSSIASAISLASVGHKSTLNVHDVLSIADELVNYVMNGSSGVAGLTSDTIN